MRWWTKKNITKIILYVLSALVYVNFFLSELWPTLYPEWLYDILGPTGLCIIFAWSVWLIVNLIKKHK